MHYKVSEACGTMQAEVINKKNIEGKVRVMTLDGGAHAGEDYSKVDIIIEFSIG